MPATSTTDPQVTFPIGPATEARILEAFAASAIVTAQVAAKLIGLDVKTLREMADAGVIRTVVVGVSTRYYTEADIRAWLSGERFGEVKRECPSTNPPKAASGTTTSSTKVIGFTEARAKRRGQKPSASRPPPC